MQTDMINGPIIRSLLRFTLPMVIGNLLQQCYNIADTLIVGRVLGADPLAAVGSAFTLMTFLTSILLGLCMGSGAFFSIRFGDNDIKELQKGIVASFILIFLLTVLINGAAFLLLNRIGGFMNVPEEIWVFMRDYLEIIFCGIFAVFIYNFFACLLRAVGNSAVPLIFLAVSALLNIGLDILFVVVIPYGVQGAATATVIAQYISAAGITVYAFIKVPYLKFDKSEFRIGEALSINSVKEIAGFSLLTCVQQSVMNLGILMVQGVVNSFGGVVMTAFAAAVKIDAFAYSPAQDFGNAFSTFTAQNFGAKKRERIREGFKAALMISVIFCLIISAAVWIFSRQLMEIFVSGEETKIISEGVRYLHIEGAFYCGIGCLFLLYGLYRGVGRPMMSVILTVISLGTRVALAYILSAIPAVGVLGIWWAVPIGWALADMAGLGYYMIYGRKILRKGGAEI
ncbi:MAG: MATE family efflux transporter [Oscillospiraceae bacterium]|nr:MATE family efflux transporter [Oscillospiraceae bacterium]